MLHLNHEIPDRMPKSPRWLLPNDRDDSFFLHPLVGASHPRFRLISLKWSAEITYKLLLIQWSNFGANNCPPPISWKWDRIDFGRWNEANKMPRTTLRLNCMPYWSRTCGNCSLIGLVWIKGMDLVQDYFHPLLFLSTTQACDLLFLEMLSEIILSTHFFVENRLLPPKHFE